MYVADICYTASIARLRVCTALRNVPGFPERLPFGLGSVLVVPRRNGGENSLRKSASPCPCCVLPLSHPAQPARALPLFPLLSPTTVSLYYSTHSPLTRRKPWLPPKRDSASASSPPSRRASSQSAQPRMSTSRPSLLLHSP